MSSAEVSIPSSNATVSARAFNVQADGSKILAALFLTPVLPGRDFLEPLPAYVFLVERVDKDGKKRRIMFDLGTRKDQENIAPKMKEAAAKMGPHVKLVVDKDVVEQLTEGGINLESIDTVIWSHTHLDHVGDLSKWPSSTKLVVGPGADRKGYPTHPDAVLLDSDFAGREVEELDFTNSKLKIAGLSAIDYLGDGSFYLIDMPGHCPGHVVALARVKPDSFVLFGADTCHHPGQIRPNPHIHKSYPCPGRLLDAARKSVSAEHFAAPGATEFDLEKRDTCFFGVAPPPHSFYADKAQSEESQKALAVLDAQKNVFVIVSHDATLEGVLGLFPEKLDDWEEKGWKEQTIWTFLEEDNKAFRLAPC
ncbi:hypothetical protein V5O48_012234 [Marasmius crinis-equi]|uniref:Metallo-beta-lactamase domain-containing protein n=1 Tax=Marasmius crinis-equi TaxID=585013 RepID=A0ABR3F3P0_9AGAR